MKRKKKYKYINYILVLIICLSLGYAVLESSLSINGTTKISSINWHVYFDNIQVNSNSMQASTPAHIIDNGTKVEYSLNFTELGQSYEFTVDAINDGDYDAMIGSLSTKINGTQTNPISDLLEYSITYSDENPIQEKDILKTGIDNKENILVKVLLKDNISNNDLARLNNINISFEIDYVQADETANEVNHEKHCIYDGELVQGAEFIDGQYTYKYKQRLSLSDSWVNMDEDGWGVTLTDKTSTDPVTTQLCKTINNKYITATTYMFNSSKATSIDVTSLDSTFVTNMSYMFANSSATTINISGINTNNVTNMNNMFEYSKVNQLDLSSFDTRNVTSMDNMFHEARLISLDLTSFYTPKLTSMNSMFNYVAAESIDLPHFNTSKITNMDSLFAGTKVPHLDLTSFDTSNVTSMNSMFNTISSQSIDISSFNTSKVTSMLGTFRNCTNLENIYIGSGWDVSNVTMDIMMFTGSTKLPNYNSSNTGKAKAYAGSDGYMTLKT